jgi:hypothetical protein
MEEGRCTTAAADPVDDRLTARVVEVGYHDFRALAGECCRTGCADARCAASHDRNLALHLAQEGSL